MSTPARLGRLAAAALIAVAAVGLGPAVRPLDVRAAAPSLSLVTATTYEVRPDEGRVAVTVQITATNTLEDTLTRRYFFDQGYLSVQPGSSNFALSAPSGARVTVSSQSADGVLLRLRFGSRIAAGKSLALTLTYDLADPGGAPDRPIRISPSLVLFPAWAYASPETPGSSVEVRIPEGYNVALGRGPLDGPTLDADGWQVFKSGPLATPLTFVADITADRPGGYVDDLRAVAIGTERADLLFQAWPDDPAWLERVRDLVLVGLPIMAEETGLAWPYDEPLTFTETFVRASDGYAAQFDPAAGMAQIGYAASPGVILHEAAHAWFNGGLVADRWIAEAFASLYAEHAAAALGLEADSPELADVPLGVAFQLNTWSASGAATPTEDAFGFAASLALAREIEALVGAEALRAAWQAAAAGEPAYQPGEAATEPGEATTNPGESTTEPGDGSTDPAAAGAGTTSTELESGAAPPDWRALLDLIQANADPAVAGDLERLWRRWVLRPADAPLLVARAEARDAYAETVTLAEPWQLPRSIRDALRAWQFEAATRLMADAAGIIRQRTAIADAAEALGLKPPPALREAFEGEDPFLIAPAEAAAELAALGQIRAAESARIAEPGLLDRLGLIGLEPELHLAAARTAFEAGDQDSALVSAAAAEADWLAVPGIARGRLISGTLLLAALILLGWLVRQRRRRAVSERWARTGGREPRGPA
ncbi:MAG: hypothetical protein EPO36_02700 [Chloroflexota bacterium]|nr:MAG: hypothetical protein EPO36_02700 [Chloroflexota bacterium]